MRLKARLRSLPVQTSTGAIHERRQKDEKQTGKMHGSPPVPKKETSVQRARRTATRHANESRMPPVLKPQILQKAAESLVSHCWTRETAASSPETLKNRHRPRQPLLDKGRCRPLNPKQTPQETAANHRQPLLDKGEHCQAQSATRSRIALRQPVLDSSRCRSPSPKFRRRQPQTVVGHCQTRACAGLQASETGKASRDILVSQCWTKVFAGFRASKPTSTSCHLSSAIAGLGCILDLRHGCQKNQTPIVVSQYWTRTSACKESLEVTGTVVSHCWTRVSETTRCQTSQH
jgi:hypothetical protein